jgi:hypothetical protein
MTGARGVYPATPVERTADLSDDGLYRYRLTRRWGPGPFATFVMLNPSTADAELDDPTIRRCVTFAARAGLSALEVVNLYAYRSTDPRRLNAVTDPIGPHNNNVLTTAAKRAADEDGLIIAAWGATPFATGRALAVVQLPGMDRLTCLGVTKSGAPRHPLYVPATALLTPWPAA